ncbi:hypothetical protein N1851_027883 [Merluccius polli]|uniref:Uncharacterized protein n=1 Tax=Merluccius polli TaxID=89951 RepID=A0AA47M9U0_MERPO|nr:hypothetical protein N1851_027883 [Merluccius polli]
MSNNSEIPSPEVALSHAHLRPMVPYIPELVFTRKELVALRANIQLMFYGFLVREDHRIYLRFLWHKDNDLAKEVAEYRTRVTLKKLKKKTLKANFSPAFRTKMAASEQEARPENSDVEVVREFQLLSGSTEAGGTRAVFRYHFHEYT